jgi:zinc transport system substrate-binding protein
MKKIVFTLLLLILLTGCDFKNNTFNNSTTYTTLYAIKYATEYMYSDYSKVNSIYLNGINVNEYEPTEKNIENYSKADIFIYSGLNDESSIARDLLNKNEKIKIIDATKDIKNISSIDEAWINPANYLIMCGTIKKTLIEYTDSVYDIKKIEEKYQELHTAVSELDAELNLLVKKANYNNILVADDLFNYLTKYNLNVISIDPNTEYLDKNITTAKKLIENGDIKYIYIVKDKELSEETNNLISSLNVTKLEINTFKNITNEEYKNKETYISLMKKINEEYKKELYK